MTTDTLTISNSRTRQEWAAVINADWRKSIESIIQTGRDLAAAKAELPHGEFTVMVETDLPFSRQYASRLIQIAAHPEIANVKNSARLPSRISTLAELVELSADDLRDAIDRGLVGPETKVKEARAIAGTYGSDPVVGANASKTMLPSPGEARKIARATGRLVAASDGNTYSGASAEEGEDYSRRRTDAFRTLEAITRLADIGDAGSFVSTIERHWLHDFRFSAIDDALAFLSDFKHEMGVVDAQ